MRNVRQQVDVDSELIALGRDLEHLRRRCRRLRNGAWASWSAAVDDASDVASRIGRHQPNSLPGLVVRYDALAWLLLEADDVIVDAAARRELVKFGKAIRAVTV